MAKFIRIRSVLVPISLALLAVSAQAAPVPTSTGAPQQWAYGAQKWVNVSAMLPNGTFTVHAFFGWDVILTATNTSSSTVAVEAVRTMGASYSAQFCNPNCVSAATMGNVSMSAVESDAGFVNMTGNATVFENGAATPALGIMNASAQSQGRVNESLQFHGMHGNVTRSVSAMLSVRGHAQASVSFSPALGLIPWNAQPNATWNSSSRFAAQGSWGIGWAAQRTNLLGRSLNVSGSPNGAVNASGRLSVAGQDLGNVTLSNGETVPAIVLALSGPFDDVDGVILVPHAFDLFGGVHHAYDASALAAQSATTSQVDFAIDTLHHRVQVVASTTVFASADQSLTTTAAAPALTPSASSTTAPSVLQGQPESITQAQQGSQCLSGACTGPSTGAAARGGLSGS
ncbi:MAG: hypothetical protein L3J96_04095, partial [Thermoplasmata archaeon]|nr:hypothetical protein [Thermoplasmata archaeon]